MDRSPFVAVLVAAALAGNPSHGRALFQHEQSPQLMSDIHARLALENAEPLALIPAVQIAMRSGSLAGVFDDQGLMARHPTRTAHVFEVEGQQTYVDYGVDARDTAAEFGRRMINGGVVMHFPNSGAADVDSLSYRLTASNGSVFSFAAERLEPRALVSALEGISPGYQLEIEDPMATLSYRNGRSFNWSGA